MCDRHGEETYKTEEKAATLPEPKGSTAKNNANRAPHKNLESIARLLELGLVTTGNRVARPSHNHRSRVGCHRCGFKPK
jgi:hypothetical protein